MRRWGVIVTLVVIAILIAIGFWWIKVGRWRTPWGVVSPDKFEQLKVGMSYEEVARIMGGPGINLPSTPPGEVPSPSAAARKIFVWPGPKPGSQISVIFENNRLKEKYKVGF
jgi:hypothetical protein